MMLNPTTEQLEFRAEVRRFLERESPVSVTRSTVESGLTHDPKVWEGLARLGALGLLIPSGYGGAGASVVEAAFVGEELGRLVVASPFLSSAVLATRLLVATEDQLAMARYLPGLADGSVVATVALLDRAGRWDPAGVGVAFENGRLHGVAPYVTDALAAGVLLVVARVHDGLGVFGVDRGAAGVGVHVLECLDSTQPLYRLEFAGVEATRIGGADATEAVSGAVRTALAWWTAAQVGVAERCLELSADYARTRVQFGRIIGAYQAIKHRCADMFIRTQSARSAAYSLIEAVRTDDPTAAEAASLAKAVCSDAAMANAADTIQIHGGIGFTWEHDAHLYFKRAKAAALLFGDAGRHRALLARRLLG